MTAVAFHRDAGRRGTPPRLHILANADAAYAYCNAHAGPHANGPGNHLDPIPTIPPPGFNWCPPCIGRWAEAEGVLNEVVADLLETLRVQAAFAEIGIRIQEGRP